MPREWAEELLKIAEQDSAEFGNSVAAAVQDLRSKVNDIDRRLQKLKEMYLDQDIEQKEYRTDKNQMVSENKSLEEQIDRLNKHQNSWLEPYKEWLKDAQNLGEITLSPELHPKKSAAHKIFGSNLFLNSRELSGTPQNQWASILEAHEEISQIGFCLTMVGWEGIELSPSD